MSPNIRALAFGCALLSLVLLPREALAARANTYTIEYSPLGFKVAIAYPEEGQLCIILPESAQDPTACLGVDTLAMTASLPEGPERPFGLAYARMGSWSYFVMLAPVGTGIESKEDINGYIDGAEKPDPALPDVFPKVIGPSPDKRYEILRINEVPVVKFQVSAGVPKESPNYQLSAMVQYAAFGGKNALISFVTSPDDKDKLMPYADATVGSLVLPPRANPERFGLPRAELERAGAKTAIMIFGPLIALGALLFLWLARGKKEEDKTPQKPKKAADRVKDTERDEAHDDEGDGGEDDASEEDDSEEDEEGGSGDEKDDSEDEGDEPRK